MLFQGRFTLKAPIQRVWDFLLDTNTLASCLPGAEKIEQVDEKTYDCVVKQKVGPISVRFKFRSIITEMDAPRHLELEGKGEDIGKAGHFVQRTKIDLKEIAEDEVEVSYHSDVRIAGRLSVFGDRIMRSKAKNIEGEFTEALKRKLKMLIA